MPNARKLTGDIVEEISRTVTIACALSSVPTVAILPISAVCTAKRVTICHLSLPTWGTTPSTMADDKQVPKLKMLEYKPDVTASSLGAKNRAACRGQRILLL